MQEKVLKLLPVKRGHFLLESGHHGDLWLVLESLCLQPRLAQEAAIELAEALRALCVDVVCGPLVEGALIAMLVALHLDVQFIYAERFARPTDNGCFLPATGSRAHSVRRYRESASRS